MGKNISPWGIRCKQQMLLKRMSLKELSGNVALTPSYVSAIINGRIIPPDYTIEKISKALDIPLSRFYHKMRCNKGHPVAPNTGLLWV